MAAGVTIEAWGGADALDDIPSTGSRRKRRRWRASTGSPRSRFPAARRMAASGSGKSAGGAISTGVVPDAATCPECLAEVMDPADRRSSAIAFANCTHCGPRLSIVRAIPYDRAKTSMSAFPMCEDCAREYADPADRRFHAQPNACPVCGPQVWLEDSEGQDRLRGPGCRTAAARLKAGAIAAIKGIGGFHLACDATSEQAVAELQPAQAPRGQAARGDGERRGPNPSLLRNL